MGDPRGPAGARSDAWCRTDQGLGNRCACESISVRQIFGKIFPNLVHVGFLRSRTAFNTPGRAGTVSKHPVARLESPETRRRFKLKKRTSFPRHDASARFGGSTCPARIQAPLAARSGAAGLRADARFDGRAPDDLPAEQDVERTALANEDGSLELLHLRMSSVPVVGFTQLKRFGGVVAFTGRMNFFVAVLVMTIGSMGSANADTCFSSSAWVLDKVSKLCVTTSRSHWEAVVGSHNVDVVSFDAGDEAATAIVDANGTPPTGDVPLAVLGNVDGGQEGFRFPDPAEAFDSQYEATDSRPAVPLRSRRCATPSRALRSLPKISHLKYAQNMAKFP